MLLASRKLPPAVAAVAFVTQIAAPRAASAEGVSVSPGVHISVSFGDKLAFGLGVDVRASVLLKGEFAPCNSKPRTGLGPFLQATWLNFSGGRFAAGMHGGTEIGAQLYSVDGELGWTYRTSLGKMNPGGHGIHVGILQLLSPPIPAPQAELSLRTTISWLGEEVAPEGTVGIGPRLPNVFGFPQTCVIGRPLRSDDGIVLAPAALLGPVAGRALALDPSVRSAIGGAWLDDARGECSSIPAFLALARDLADVGAPAELSAAALDAARDEVLHTALTSTLASDYLGQRVAPLLLAPPRPGASTRTAALTRLAVESWQDGCLGEGAAARRAERAFASAADERVRAALAQIARDEQRHAELGLRVLDHCLREGGKPVRAAIDAELAVSAPPPLSEVESGDEAAGRVHGRLARAGADSAWEENYARARRDVARLLS